MNGFEGALTPPNNMFIPYDQYIINDDLAVQGAIASAAMV